MIARRMYVYKPEMDVCVEERLTGLCSHFVKALHHRGVMDDYFPERLVLKPFIISMR